MEYNDMVYSSVHYSRDWIGLLDH